MGPRFRLPLAVALVTTLLAVPPAAALAEGGWAFAEAPDGVNVEEGTEVGLLSEDLIFESESMLVECDASELAGTLTENGPETATMELTSSRFEATGGGKCKTNTSATVTVKATGLPWTAGFTEGGEITIKGEGGASFSVAVYLFESLLTTCVYEASNVTGEFTIGESLGAVFPVQSLTRTSGSESLCGKSASLSGTAIGGGDKYTYGLWPAPPTTLREKSKTGAALAVNSTITGTSTNFYVSHNDGSGRVDCANGSFTGKVTNNGKGVETNDISSIEFNSGKDKWCTSTVKPGGVASRAVITPENTPWELIFWDKGAGSFRRDTMKFREELFKTTDETLLRTCRYTGAWTTTYTMDLALGLAVLPPFGGLPRDNAGSDNGCSATVNIGGSFSVLTSPGKQTVFPTSP